MRGNQEKMSEAAGFECCRGPWVVWMSHKRLKNSPITTDFKPRDEYIFSAYLIQWQIWMKYVAQLPGWNVLDNNSKGLNHDSGFVPFIQDCMF